MESKNRGFILTHYTDFNGKKWTRDEIAERVYDFLADGAKNVTQMSQKFKIKTSSLMNILAYMVDSEQIKKTKTVSGPYMYSKIKECLLAEMLLPSPDQVEKMFKIKDRKTYKVDDGTSKGFGGSVVDPYKSSAIHSIYWGDGD